MLLRLMHSFNSLGGEFKLFSQVFSLSPVLGSAVAMNVFVMKHRARRAQIENVKEEKRGQKI